VADKPNAGVKEDCEPGPGEPHARFDDAAGGVRPAFPSVRS
jgi:hypothetical protein